MKTAVRVTSIESYSKVQGVLKTQLDKAKIITALSKGPLSDAQLVAATGLPINILTGRRNDMWHKDGSVAQGRFCGTRTVLWNLPVIKYGMRPPSAML